MNNKKLRNIISNIFVIIIIIVAFFIYRKYDYNFFTKGIFEAGKTVFSRDSNIKYSKQRSYKIENKASNDALFYKEISVLPNTPYKVTCMVKTQNVIGEKDDALAGAQVCLNGTEEHSRVLQGNNDWTKIEFFFNSKCNDKLEIGFRLGGNMKSASGTAWFSDFTLEEGAQGDSNTWNFGCFILDYANVEIDNSQRNYVMTEQEKSIVNIDMKRLQSSIKEMSNNQMEIEYDIIEIKEPLTTLSYDKENGYYINEKDVYQLIDSYVQEKEYDHIFVCTNLPLESELTHDKDICEWVGLGNMLYLGKGFSNIRIIINDYSYSSNNTFPEEVFLHEFLHTLERNSKEYGYTVPALHNYEFYNYENDRTDRLRKWYIAYMNGIIPTDEGYIGLPSKIYTLKPAKSTDFIYSNKLDKLDEPKNIIEEINSVIYKVKRLFENKESDYNLATVEGA